jgi:radical SAM protein with 4Fe4S-binding SPASM domain
MKGVIGLFSHAKRIFIEITSNCNHNCKYCYYYNNLKQNEINKNLYISDDVIDKFCSDLKENYNDENIEVVLTGGEPFIDKQRLHNILDKIRATNAVFHLSINTNLTLIEQEDIEKIQDVGLFFSLVSLDKDIYEYTTEGNYDLFIRKLKMIINSNINLTGNIVVNSLNIEDVRKTVAKAKMMGLKNINLTYIHYNKTALMKNISKINQKDINEQQLRQFFALGNELSSKYENITINFPIQPCMLNMEKEKVCFNCGCADGIYAIGVDGNLKPCEHDPFQIDFNNVYSDMSVKQSAQDMKQYKIDNTAELPIECQQCDMVQFCNATCGKIVHKPDGAKIDDYDDFKKFCPLLKSGKELTDNTKYIIDNFLPPWEMLKYYR